MRCLYSAGKSFWRMCCILCGPYYELLQTLSLMNVSLTSSPGLVRANPCRRGWLTAEKLILNDLLRRVKTNPWSRRLNLLMWILCLLEYAVPVVVKPVLICMIWGFCPGDVALRQTKGQRSSPESLDVNGKNADNDCVSREHFHVMWYERSAERLTCKWKWIVAYWARFCSFC